MDKLFERNATGCNLPSNSWDNTAPTAKLLASVSIIKGLSLSGFFKIGEEVNKCFNLSKASCWSLPQINLTFFLVSLWIGFVILTKSLMKRQ